MGVRAPADKRFRRAQVTPGRRRRSVVARLRAPIVVLAFAAAIAYTAYRAADLVGNAAAFRIERLVVSGNARLSTGEVMSRLDGLHGQSILVADLERWRRRLLTSPWVEEAAFRRSLPSTIEIAITERTPMGIGRVGGQLFLIDRHGAIIDEFGPQYAQFDLPIIDGLPGPPRAAAPLIDDARADLAARLLAAVRAHAGLARRVSQVDVSDARDAVVILEGDPALIHLGAERFAERLRSYLELAPALRARVKQIDHVDLRFDDRVYVRPAGEPRATTKRVARSDAGGRSRF